MIEMIATLAIIGVLSAVGVWGLNNALTKHKVNTLIEDVRLSGFIVADELFKSLPDDEEGMNLAGKFEKQTSYEFRAFAEKETTFEILVKNVPYGVCEEVKKRKVEWLEEIKANGIPNTCNEGTSNDISFFFNTELMGNTEQQTEECRANKDCPSDRPYCVNGYCSKCISEYALNKSGECVSCTVDSFAARREECYTKCENKYFVSGYGECRSCGTNSNGKTTLEECKHCTNHCFEPDSPNSNMGMCHVMGSNATKDENGYCNACPAGTARIRNERMNCISCTVDSFAASREECYTKCENKYFVSEYGECKSCGINSHGKTTLEDCKHCTNHYFNESTEKCQLCPTGKKASADGLSCVDQ